MKSVGFPTNQRDFPSKFEDILKLGGMVGDL